MKFSFKAFIIVLLLLSLSFALFACVDNDNTGEEGGTSDVTDTPNEGGNSSTATPEDTPAEGGNEDNSTPEDGGASSPEDESSIQNVFVFELSSDKEGYVLKSVTVLDGEVIIPATYADKPVTEIAEKVFYSNDTLTSVTLPASLKRIGSRAFSLCINLKEVKGENGSALKEIGERAFYQCERLESVALPEGLEEVGAEAFCGCAALTSLSFPGSLSEIGAYAFHCGWYEALPDGLVIISGVAYSYKLTPSTETLPASVAIPSGTVAVAEKAFYGNAYISSVSIPASVTNIGEKAFANMIGLTSISVESSNASYSSEGNCLTEKSAKRLLTALSDSVIPDWVEVIGAEAFAFRRDISAVTLPAGVMSIEANAFEASSVTEVNIPAGVAVIEERVFLDCDKLASIHINEAVSEIKSAAFNGCTSLKEITIDSDDILELIIGKLNSPAALMAYAECVYVSDECEGISPYLVASFDEVQSDKTGYKKYVINS